MAAMLGDKRLGQLKVAELREQLEKRGLSKTGVKVDLVKRLSDAILKEGSDNETQGDEAEVEGQSGVFPHDELPGSSSFEMSVRSDEVTLGEETQHTEEEATNQASSIIAQDKEIPVTQESSEKEEKIDYSSSSPRSQVEPQSFVREGTPLQDETSEVKKDNVPVQEDPDVKEPDPVIDLHVRDAFEMIEDVTSQDGKDGEENVKGNGKTVERGSEDREIVVSSKCHLWVSGTGGSLSKSITAVDLQDFFSKCGNVLSARIVARKNRYHPPKCYGFVTMKSEKEADTCIRELSLRELKGQKLLIEIAKHPPPSSSASQHAEDNRNVSEKSSESSGNRSRDSRKDNSDKSMPDDAFRKEDNKVVEHTKGSDASHSNDEFPSLQDSDLDRRSPDRERHRESPRRRSSLERRLDRRHSPRRARRSRSPRRVGRSPRRHSPRGRSPPRGDLRRMMRGSDERGPFDGKSRGLLPDPIPSSSRGAISRFEGRLEPRSDIIVRTTEELFQRELAIQRHEKQLAEQMKALRDREMKEKIASIEQDRRLRDRERELLDRERRDRQLREELERELKHKAMKEKELIERERKSLEQMEKQLREREMRFREEKESHERNMEERERQLRERERMLQQQSSYDYRHSYNNPPMHAAQKRSIGPAHSEYEAKRVPPAHMVSPYSMTGGRPNMPGGSTLSSTSNSGWSGMMTSTQSYQSREQPGYSADKKPQLSGYDSLPQSSNSYNMAPGYAQGRPLDRQQESVPYSQHQPNKDRGTAPMPKPTAPHGMSGDQSALQGWRNQPARTNVPTSNARGYGQQERPNTSNSSTSATGNLLAERSGPSVMNRSPFSLRGRGRGRGRGSVSPHNPQIAHRFPQSRDSSGMSHMYPGGGRRY